MTSEMVNHMQNNKTSPQACRLFWCWAGFGIPSLDLSKCTLHTYQSPLSPTTRACLNLVQQRLCASDEYKLNNNQKLGQILPLEKKKASSEDRHQFFSFRGAQWWSTNRPCCFKEWSALKTGVYESQVRLHPEISSTQGMRHTFSGGRCDESHGQVERGRGFGQCEGSAVGTHPWAAAAEPYTLPAAPHTVWTRCLSQIE